ncbi:unnamed protein product [Fusarium graminearum]|nr:unnamed protein product [Fusarium graminearum]CAG1980225.1 unnamed protein product [Fusarium graminearum]
MTPEESLRLIKANLAEILNPEIIDNVVLNEKRPLEIYWGTATTGKPHCGYFVPMVKIAELLEAGCHVKILIADMENITKFSIALKANSEVVKQDDDPIISGVTYPIMQALDEEYLKVDAELGGVDQRKIFTFALENLPKLGYKKRAHLMNVLLPGLGQAQKMSSSDPSSKIGLLDTPEEVSKKIGKAVCGPRVVEGNGVIAFIEHVIFRILAFNGTVEFMVEQRDGEILVYQDIDKLEQDYEQDILTPQAIKPALIQVLNELLEPIREEFKKSEEWQLADRSGYPPEVKPVKAKKTKT